MNATILPLTVQSAASKVLLEDALINQTVPLCL